MGVFVLLIGIIAFTLGAIRGELVLTLTGAVLFTVLAYTLAASLVLGLIHRRRASLLLVRIAPRETGTGGRGEMVFRGDGRRFIRLPGVLLRYELNLITRDGRIIRHVFDPDIPDKDALSFPVEKRGAYYGPCDRFTIGDALGLFCIGIPVPQDRLPRLLALPGVATEFALLPPQGGGTRRRPASRFLRSDNLIDHRPYVPGDDPRRINWKLYGHAGDLFVREEEREPPPQGKLTLLLDTQRDPRLYNEDKGRRGVDLLCEYALAGIMAYFESGLVIETGYAGGGILGGSPPELAATLAYPAALTDPGELPLPPEGDDGGVLVLALPRTGAADSVLDRFLRCRGNRRTDLLFLYEGGRYDAAAEGCVRTYNHRGGIHARCLRF
jgi:uncharacterized protein (DUF58 family)